MIVYREHNQIDKTLWDNTIKNSCNGNLYAFSWFLDKVSPEWCALTNDDYSMLFPLPVWSRMGIKYVMQPYFTQQLGLFCLQKQQLEFADEFVSEAKKRFSFLDMNLNAYNTVSNQQGITFSSNFELDLNRSYTAIYEGYHLNLKRNLKKAVKSAFELKTNIAAEDVIKLFRAYKGQNLKQLDDKEYQLLESIQSYSNQLGISQLWGVYLGNQLLAGALWIQSQGKTIFLFSAVSDEGKKLMAMSWLIDKYISTHSEKPLILDFEGSNNNGLARFYAGFGALNRPYLRVSHNNLVLPAKLALYLWQKSRIRLKKYLSMLNN